MWGQEQYKKVFNRDDRIIPMRVGTSPCSPQLPQVAEDHPHACGDKNEYFRGCIHRRGSSPCVWGQAQRKTGFTLLLRIIPMRVGTSTVFHNQALPCADHPHACGDKFPRAMPVLIGVGSSPCVWGQVASSITIDFLSRIIPMRVGTSFVSVSNACSCSNHPHACGDKFYAFLPF